MTAPMLSTKLYIPPARASLVARPRLFERLDDGLRPGRRLILLSAPAGSGKTTLLSAWIARLASIPAAELPEPAGRTAFAWLSLDSGDNDPSRFLRYLIAALRQVEPGLGKSAAALLSAPMREKMVSVEGVLTNLINDLAGYAQPVVLVLDDYHLVDQPAIHEAVAYLVDHLPPFARLAIATRGDPPLPLPRWRARAQVAELHAADLRFSPEEAAVFLNQVMRLELAPDDISVLSERTEGWIAGLQLASLALKSGPEQDVSRFIAAFTGSNRYILDYLVEEVLARQPEAVQWFMLMTSVLDRMCAALCEAVISDQESVISKETDLSSLITNQRVTNQLIPNQLITISPSILSHLDRSNLFVVPLDGERTWYRYHNLFAEFLRGRLCQRLTQALGSEAACREQVRALHRRASAWFEQADLVSEAIDHALKAEDYTQAVRLIETRARWSVMMPGESAPVLNWMEQIPEPLARSRPALCLTYAWALLSAGRNPQAEAWAKAAQEILAEQGALAQQDILPESRDACLSESDGILALTAVMRGGLEEGITLANRALERLPEDETMMRGLVALNLGLAYDMRGAVDLALPIYRQASALGEAGDSPLIALIAEVQIGDIAMARGQLSQAAEVYRKAIQIEEQLGGRLPVAGMVYCGIGRVYYERNQLEEAAELFERAAGLGRHWESSDIFIASSIDLAQARLAQGQVEEALRHITSARAAMRGNIASPSTTRSAEAVIARMELRRGRTEPAARWAEALEGQPPAPAPAYLRVIEGGSLARVLLAQNRAAEAARLLAELLETSRAAGQQGEMIELLALQGLALQRQGKTEQALQSLHQALLLGEPEGFARTFINEGPEMRGLLLLALQRGACPAYVQRLLRAFGEPPPADIPHPTAPAAPFAAALIEPLSDRELDVLRLIAEGRSNQEIARALVVAVSTVKTHINNIYGKLGVQGRVQAVTRARELKIV